MPQYNRIGAQLWWWTNRRSTDWCLWCSVILCCNHLSVFSLSLCAAHSRKWLIWKCWIIMQVLWQWYVDFRQDSPLKCRYPPLLSSTWRLVGCRHEMFQTSDALFVLKLVESEVLIILPYVSATVCPNLNSYNKITRKSHCCSVLHRVV